MCLFGNIGLTGRLEKCADYVFGDSEGKKDIFGFFFQFLTKNWVGRVRKPENKKTLALLFFTCLTFSFA